MAGYNNVLPRSFNATQYDIGGLERCDAIFADPVSERAAWRTTMDSDALSAMDRSILTMRFKDWKPIVDSSIAQKLQPNKAYCYLFNSNDPYPAANIQDPFLHSMSCSMDDIAALGNPEFVTNIFKDSNFDNPHSTRMNYNKCIYEIDVGKVNSNNINSFWKQLADNECKSYKDRGESAIANLAAAITQCNTVLTLNTRTLNSNIDSYNKLVKIAPQYIKCLKEKETLNQGISDVRFTYNTKIDCEWLSNSKCKLKTTNIGRKSALDQELASIQARINGLQTVKKKLNTDLQVLLTNLGNLNTQSNNLGLEYQNTSTAYAYCKEHEVPDLLDLKARLNRDIDSVVKMITALQVRQQELDQEIRLNETTNGNVKREIATYIFEINRLLNKLRACAADTEKYKNVTNTTKPEVERLMKLLQSCETTLHDRTVERDYLLSLLRDYMVKQRTNVATLGTSHNKYTMELLKRIKESQQNIVKGPCGDTSAIETEIDKLIKARQDELNAKPPAVVIDAAWCANQNNNDFKNACCKA